jgi:hypothetical protein
MISRLAGALLLPLGLVAGLALVLAGLWQAQSLSVSRLLSRYEQAKVEPVAVREEVGERNTLLRPDDVLPGLAQTDKLGPFDSCGDYLVLDMDYDGRPIWLRSLYEGANDWVFTHKLEPHIEYPGHPCRIRCFFPVYQTTWPEAGGVGWNKFAGVEVENGRRGAIHGLYRMVDGNTFALWPCMTVPEERETFVGCKSGPHDRAFAVVLARLRALLPGAPAADEGSFKQGNNMVKKVQ